MISLHQYFSIIKEKGMSKYEVEELIYDAEEVARKIATNSKRVEEEIETAREVIKFVKDVRKTFIKKGIKEFHSKSSERNCLQEERRVE